MEYKIIFSDYAENDIFEIYYFIALNDSFEIADKIHDKIINKAFKLFKYPFRGHLVSEVADTYPNTREIIEGQYRIIYEIDDDIVTIEAVLDGRRNIEELLKQRLLK